mmetsp:Transcript_75413/g.182204  ORF Transcript_75413/g.182204 Transcript_75413/m.182204 type:complete len:238 (-) Transcript_75413:33-746(-)
MRKKRMESKAVMRTFFALAGGASAAAASCLAVVLTDCLSGVYRRRLGRTELADLRYGAGMGGFSWAAFLRLLAAALRGEAGCSASAELLGLADAEVRPCLQLALRFRLEAAALTGHISLGECAATPPASPLAREYLAELRRFLVDAVTTARGDSGATHRQHLGEDATMQLSQRMAGATTASQSGSLAMFNSEKPEGAAGSSRGNRGHAAKKRVGGSLVAPQVRRGRCGGANPFQLSG